MPARDHPDRGARAGAVRCAIYTRKSSDEGLDQAFNSLDAQREACEAYVVSQRHDGWVAVPDMYDDGGLSGGSMNRPALQRLLDDIRSGEVTIVVVYKVDRLTRSLADFAKIVDVLDEAGASFVSVTQQFNTTTSMGRLTLNMLLSFAQFEREIAGERIRDKIAASKARGMWMGGSVPLGYDAIDRKLVINPAEAKTVKLIFERYAALGSVRLLREELDRRCIVSKQRTSTSGVITGGRPFSRGPLYALLQNPLYIGKIVHRGQTYDGQHDAIIERELWNRVQARLADRRRDRKLGRSARTPSLLAGLVYDADGYPLTPSHANKNGRRYRYYVSTRLNDPVAPAEAKHPTDTDNPTPSTSAVRVPAADLEALVFDRLYGLLASSIELADAIAPLNLDAVSIDQALKRAKALKSKWPEQSSQQRRALAIAMIDRIDVAPEQVIIAVNRIGLIIHLGLQHEADCEPIEPLLLTIAAHLHRCGKGKRIVIEGEAPGPDDALVTMLQQAFAVRDDLLSGRQDTLDAISRNRAMPNGRATALLRLSWLAPSIIRDIMDGRQPANLTPNTLLRTSKDLPMDWDAQRVHLGFETR